MQFDRFLGSLVVFSMFLVISGCRAEEQEAQVADLPALTPSPEGAEVYIISPEDGSTVSSPFVVEFGIDGMTIVPAGSDEANSGHHHLLVNGEMPPLDMPLLDQVTHFGGGQTETTLTLEPGEHTLQLILGDGLHTPHDPPVVSEIVSITVE